MFYFCSLLSHLLLGPIPSEFGQLTKLTKLYFEQCSLTGTIPSEIGQLIAMERFRVQANQLTGTNIVVNQLTIDSDDPSMVSDC